MNRINMISVVTRTILGIAILALTNVAHAMDMGDMMKPGKWFGNDDDDHHYRYGRGYWRGPYGYGPYGGPYGYGGYPGYGPYSQPRTIIIDRSGGGERAAPRPLPPE